MSDCEMHSVTSAINAYAFRNNATQTVTYKHQRILSVFSAYNTTSEDMETSYTPQLRLLEYHIEQVIGLLNQRSPNRALVWGKVAKELENSGRGLDLGQTADGTCWCSCCYLWKDNEAVEV